MKIQGKIVKYSFRSSSTNSDLMFVDVQIRGIIHKDMVREQYEAFKQSHKVQVTETSLGGHGDLGYEILMEVIE